MSTQSPSFADLGVPDDLIAVLTADNIVEPSPIQAATLPDALAGRDVCGRAPTGSGKTLAFGIPIVARSEKAVPHRPTALVLVPTRELATQVTKVLVPLARARRLYVLAVYGGASIHVQASSLRRGASIVVATPGRLTDLVQQGLVHLSDIHTVVLDEADRMADMGFLPQVRRILDLLPADRQTLLWSATLDSDVDSLIARYQRNPVRHEVAVEPARLGDMTHAFLDVDVAGKAAAAAEVLREHGQGIVFCRTRYIADRVARQLDQQGLRTAVVHGRRTQPQRERALDAFRRGQAEVLVATDVAARGLHIDDVAVVIHWDPVDDPKDYVHRSGRTARAGAQGTVVSLVAPVDVAKVRALKGQLDLPGVPKEPSRAPAGGRRHVPSKSSQGSGRRRVSRSALTNPAPGRMGGRGQQ